MKWIPFLLRFFTFLALSIAVSTLLLGGIGLAVAGKEGMLNGAGWGLLLGVLVGVNFGLLLALSPKRWGDFAARGIGWWIKRPQDDQQLPMEQEDYSKWKL